MTNQGWQCPACKTVYAPHVEKCECVKSLGATGSTKLPLHHPPSERPSNPYPTAGDPIECHETAIWIAPYNPKITARFTYGRQLNHTGSPTYQNFQIPRPHHF